MMSDSTRWLDRDPTTPAELYDMLRWMFGLGAQNPDPEQPYWQARNVEIGKVKSSMTRRGSSLAELVATARWCHEHHVPILVITQLYRYIPDAKRAARAAYQTPLELQVDAAIARERALADPMSDGWISRLTRAQGPFRQEVLDAWQQTRATASAN